jgi:uncharacterized membrane protein YidH (DUF202 family)
MTIIKRTLFTIIASFGLLVPLAVPAIVGAQTEEVNIGAGLCSGASFELNPECSTNADETSSRLTDYIRLAINIFSVIVGIIAVIMLIIGGLKYITSGGDSGNVTGAKNTILYAIIGLVIVALAQVIVQFVIGTFQQ